MIYTVELNYSDNSTKLAWGEWYEAYLQQLVSLDGLDTAQRFQAICKSSQFWEFLAVYTVSSLDVYDTVAYHSIGGGGNASKAFHHAISRRRNVYAGVTRMPAVPGTARLLLCENMPHGFDLPGISFVPLILGTGNRQAGATKIDGQPKKRAIAVAKADTVDHLGLTAIDGLAVYAPITRYYN